MCQTRQTAFSRYLRQSYILPRYLQDSPWCIVVFQCFALVSLIFSADFCRQGQQEYFRINWYRSRGIFYQNLFKWIHHFPKISFAWKGHLALAWSPLLSQPQTLFYFIFVLIEQNFGKAKCKLTWAGFECRLLQ